MKHYAVGFVFNKTTKRVLLIKKVKPEWAIGKWNGIGGKIESTDLSPYNAMLRESLEETGHNYPFKHCVTFTCPGGTVFVFAAFLNTEHIPFLQMEDEPLQVWDIEDLPAKLMNSGKWIIPICLAELNFPIFISQKSIE
jgi:8-oxo-dGTP pyrophosphatase MutT (NUDIX family)